MPPQTAPPRRFLRRLRRTLRELLSARRGAIAVIFALLAPVLALCAIGVIDIATLESTKTHLQDATDAAALAVSAAAAANPNTPETSLQTTATTLLQTDFQNGSQTVGALTPTISSFKVCTPVQIADCAVVNGQALITNTVSMVTSVRAHCYAPLVMPGLCNSAEQSVAMTVSNTTNIGYAGNVQINMLLDVSGSMIVGSTAADIAAGEKWNSNSANWATVHNPNESGQTSDCAFACHDQGNSSQGVNGPTTSGSANSDMQMGETNAKAAGATTRLDVMLQSVASVITDEQSYVANSTTLSKDSYYFNITTIADSLTNIYTAAKANDWTDPVNSLSKAYVGLDTDLTGQLPTYANQIGVNGAGPQGAPIKFVVLISDGLQSDFYKDFTASYCSASGPDTPWQTAAYYGANSASPTWQGYYGACYAAPMSTAGCTTMKNNGVVVAVLETPYVPLTGQDQGEKGLYETVVRHTIYPTGPNASSTVSTQLQACATSPQYYYQANTSDQSSIAKGLTQLINTFLASTAYVKQ